MKEYLLYYILSIPVGIIIGIIGSITGIGGGFILMPILLILFPEKSPSELTAVTMTVIFVNSISGSISKIKLKKINYRDGILFSICSIPAVILGAYFQHYFDTKIFSLFFGIFLVLSSIFIFFINPVDHENFEVNKSILKIAIGGIASIFIGFISSFFGIGGGFIFVPFLIYFLKYPVKNATANSLFILMSISLTVIILSILNHKYTFDIYIMPLFVIGVIAGSIIGSALSGKIKNNITLKILCGLLVIAGLKLIIF
jgi:uncharacterized protein